MKNKKFPDYFPPDCPPKNAKIGRMAVFRAIKGEVPCEQDFICVHKLYPKRIIPESERLNSYGLSFYKNIDDLKAMISSLSMNIRNKRFNNIASGYMTEEYGVYLETPKNNNSHVTWWIYDDILLHPIFKKVD